ncbi:hypothetical protein LPJ78_004412 [Coemansia sp. RSA 989]|nr:galactose mutarotase-like domain-containing protein [Coemansia mojavensis]KAJ1740378.1 hypothetical protein LPJ68_003820 [Coemansia sp. RSA 1086]KAJ1862882.1 hypothetical protein LPJ78_004412 [Coemansia sp. RSA 989]KAJ2677294.1 hypothetical protein IWW42_000100 [Coemansia sp. RSA 1085]
MAVTKHAFSQDGTIDEYVLSNKQGTKVYVTNWGARLTRFIVADKTGTLRDIVAGFEDYESWQKSLAIDDPYFGATIGRVAGRIWPCDNVLINGQPCQLPEIQPNKVYLHGGINGFDKKLFSGQVLSTTESAAAVEFAYISEDKEEGFPGDIELRVKYTLDQENGLHIEYLGTLLSGTETILNPTNHTYWNLTGFAEPTIHHHMCRLTADRVMECRADIPMVPTGRLLPIKNTKLDFTQLKQIGEDLDPSNAERGLDHVFVMENEPGSGSQVREAAVLESPKSGLRLTVLTDQPALVVYTGNWISDKLVGKYGVRYGNYAAIALEAQQVANAANLPEFRSQVVVTRESPFTHHTVYRVNTT